MGVLRSYQWLVGGIAAALLAAGAVPLRPTGPSPDSPRSARQTSTGTPNIILIITDDQRWDSLAGVAPDYMPQDVMVNTMLELANNGIVFSEAFVTSPLCCPARASLLSGGFYAHNTGVLLNQWPNGSALKFNDQQSLATLLQARGYRTALIGKYLNGIGGFDGH